MPRRITRFRGRDLELAVAEEFDKVEGSIHELKTKVLTVEKKLQELEVALAKLQATIEVYRQLPGGA